MSKVRKIDLTAAICFLLLLMTLPFMLAGTHRAQQDLDQYNAAPGCRAGGPASGPGPSCRTATMMVVSKERYTHNKRSDDYFLNTAERNGATYSAGVGPLCYARAIEGQRVAVQVWKSNIVLFIYPDRTYKTHYHPSVILDDNSLIYVYGIIVLGGALILIFWLMIRRVYARLEN